MDKFQLQDNQYQFPYHYLVNFDGGYPIPRTMSWAWEYFSYISYVIEKIEELDVRSVLDIGCGDGVLLNALSNDIQKTGIDLSDRAIRFANAFADDAEFLLTDIADYQQSAEMVTLIEVIEHIPDNELEPFLLHASRLTEKYLTISVPTDVIPVSPKHYRHYNETLLAEHVRPTGLELVHSHRVYRKSLTATLLRKMVFNRIFQIRSPAILKFFWTMFTKTSLHASPTDGVHLIAIYKKP